MMPTAHTSATECASPGPEETRRILIVEDEAMIALLVQETLSDVGYRIAGVAPRLAVGLDMARSAAIDVAVLDINLNGEECFPIARVLRDRNVPFLFASGCSEDGIPAEYSQVPVVTKPYNVATLMSALSSI
jgi:DNA-binding response OmpR family regulator